MKDFDDHVISYEEAVRRRRLLEEAQRQKDAVREVKISDAMSHLLEEEAKPDEEGASPAVLRRIVEREFVDRASQAPHLLGVRPVAAADVTGGGGGDAAAATTDDSGAARTAAADEPKAADVNVADELGTTDASAAREPSEADEPRSAQEPEPPPRSLNDRPAQPPRH